MENRSNAPSDKFGVNRGSIRFHLHLDAVICWPAYHAHFIGTTF
jgi:hypothetical protein